METFFATLIGAVIAFCGVLLTLRHNQKIHVSNLAHEREKAKKDRDFRSKQDALISASEAVTRFLTYFISIPDRPLESDGSVAPEVANLGVALNKLHFYCDLETIESSTKLGQILNEIVSHAMQAKMPSAFIAEDIKGIDLQISNIERQIAIQHEEIRALLFSDPQSPVIPQRESRSPPCIEIPLNCMV